MTTGSKIQTFVIADDHPLVLGGVRGVLEHIDPSCRILEAQSYPDLLLILERNVDISLIIADLNMPGLSGLQGIAAVQDKRPEIPLMVISATESQKVIDKVMDYGVAGYMFKSFSYKDMQYAIEKVLKGEMYVPQGTARSLSTDEILGGVATDFGQKTLERLPMGVVIVDGAARVLFKNSQAGQLLAQGDGLEISADQVLRAGRPENSKALNALISEATKGSEKSEGGVLTVSRPSCKRDYSLLIVPLPADDHMDKKDNSVAVFINDPELHNEPPIAVLARLYDLTTTEARVLQALIVGKNLETVAEEFGVSMNTVRSHLKQVFRKTGTNRQPELVSLVLNSSAYLASNPVNTGRSYD